MRALRSLPVRAAAPPIALLFLCAALASGCSSSGSASRSSQGGCPSVSVVSTVTGEKDWSGVVVPTLTTPAVQLGPCIYRSRSGQSVSVGVFAPEAKDAAELLSQAEASSSSRRAVSVPGLGIAAFVFPVASLPGFNNLSLTVLTATHEIVVDGSIPAGQLEALAGRVIASEHGR